MSSYYGRYNSTPNSLTTAPYSASKERTSPSRYSSSTPYNSSAYSGGAGSSGYASPYTSSHYTSSPSSYTPSAYSPGLTTAQRSGSASSLSSVGSGISSLSGVSGASARTNDSVSISSDILVPLMSGLHVLFCQYCYYAQKHNCGVLLATVSAVRLAF